MIEGIVLIIPVYNPDEKFTDFLDKLTADGWKDIIIVDDGSKPEYGDYFDKAVNQFGCQVVKHNVNLGQGRALKSAFNYGLKPVEYDVVFRVPKNGIMRNNKPPAMRVEDKRLIAKITFPV